ncbi:putative flavonol 3-O-glucosyltransferase [Rosa chinensis]|uniref:Glycosyltransferase n=1 Tax=Rosa chinensis TaxID=74649 RepID=A0A2P6PM67_ROSCH|nr:UDP-glucose flavonoid 3-O-glucosyltransferase 7 [Rosa chinensis]PRQ23006.1 putative flavonol 3-O-glucosyltransferase [Rosa chinensis]
METKPHPHLHIFFLPFMAQGHTLPMIDIAKLFASRGVKCTIVTTPANAPIISKAIQTSKGFGFEIEVVVIKFPSAEVGLPEGSESTKLEKTDEMREKFLKAITLFEQQVEKILDQHHPHCLVADFLFHWATNVAAKFGIPRFVFHGAGFFALCSLKSVMLYQPHMKVSSDSESFVIPSLPDEIIMTRNQLAPFLTRNGKTELIKLIKASREAEERSYGIIVNSYYELEPDYADHYRKVLGKKSWHIGPVSLCNKVEKDKSERGREGSVDEVHECLNWLNSKKPNSVVYICFGSMTKFSDCQLIEIAFGLEASQQQFIWVVNKENNDKEEWLPEGFKQRNEGKGLVIRGWAPQLLILQNEAVGVFVTHCGWNSILEGVSSGVPMITWPVSADQFFNEKLVTQILGIGIAIGAQKWEDDSVQREANVKREAIEKAVTEFMVGNEQEEMRSKVLALGQMARRAVAEGGSSHSDLTALIGELWFLVS